MGVKMIEKFDLLTLLHLDGIGCKTIINFYEEAKHRKLINLEFNDYIYILEEHFNKKYPKKEIEKSKLKAEKILESCYLNKIEIMSFLDKNYPKRFKNIKKDKPVLLYIKGNKKIMEKGFNLAVVGSRKSSDKGLKLAYNYSKKAADNGFNIISGLALGCDTAGHKGSLDSFESSENMGKTLAVLPSGINNIYPYENKNMALEIIDKEGCLLSEKSPNEQPNKYDFISRDRLQAALSEWLLIVESRIDGGTAYTAEYGIKYRKKLMCVGINIENKGMELNKKLIEKKEGVPIESLNDLMDLLTKERDEHNEISHQ